MELSFITQFADKRPTNFEYKVVVGEKLHAFREGARWTPGKAIHMVINPGSDDRFQFNMDRPQLQTCTGVQPWAMHFGPDGQLVLLLGAAMGAALRPVSPYTLLLITRNEGFDSVPEFFAYYHPRVERARIDTEAGSGTEGRRTLKGQIVHWTDLRY